ncbi:MAG: AMP-binding protein [Desulfosudaceae bacterium]
MSDERFWTRSYDPGVSDLDPAVWETTYTAAIQPAFQKYRDKTALSYMGVDITFGELDRYANRFARMLLDNGLQKGDVVGINLPNIPEYVIAWLGTLRAGCAVSGVSPLLSAGEMKHQLSDARARGLVTLDAIFAGRLTGIAADLPDLKVVAAASVGGFLPAVKRFLGKRLGKIPTGKVSALPGKQVMKMEAVIKTTAYPDTDPAVDLTPDDLAYIQYTGGTTGLPKGAMLTHRNVVADLFITQHWLGWEEGRGLALSGFPFFHIAGLFFNKNCVYLGWTQVLIPNPRDTDHICKEIEKHQPSVLVNVPSLYQLLLANPRFQQLDHTPLEVCISAASPFPEESQRELERIVGAGKLLEVYGMTETAPLTTMNPLHGKKKLGHIGLPLPNTDLCLKDPATGERVAAGEAGEICVKGPQVMPGYFNQPEETRRVFDDEGYLHTGDVAVFDEEGFLRIVDRTKDMIIVSGFKVFSRRVEDILTQHPAVDVIAIIGRDNPERPGSELVEAYVTPLTSAAMADDPAALKADLLAFAKEHLSPYEVPKEIHIIKEMPLTAVGKIDKKVLRKKQE